ncbi:MAG: hypothetical protein KAT78_06385, partial [Flavobacteriaceae bacterium]|nr:hypothetical protein [Flavobacteriaceae bacterium]
MKYIFRLQYIKSRNLNLFSKNNTQVFFRNRLFITFLLFGFVGFSQVTTKVDTTTIRIGEQIQYQIIVNETEGVQFSKLQLDNLKKVEIVKSYK